MFDIARRAQSLTLSLLASTEDFAAFARKYHAMYESLVKASEAKVE